MTRNILIGGAAGHGLNTLAYFITHTLREHGQYIHTTKDYMSRVRGGANFIQIRFGTEPILSHDPEVDIILALNQEAVNLHTDKLKEDGLLVCPSDVESTHDHTLSVPYKDIGAQTHNPKGISAMAAGVLIKALGLSEDALKHVTLPMWKAEIKEKNYTSAKLAYEQAKAYYKLEIPSASDEMLYMNGNQAIALGALAGGLDFYAAYPMAPSTGIMKTLSQFEKKAGILVDQAEDEIAAINTVIGASATGARSMTGSSGGGFSLMVEALGFAGIGEVPIVIVDVQRPGPATGLPTRTEQSDLSFVLTASQGEMPRMVIAVKDVRDAFYQAARALNIAEAYRIPVILLSDQYLADMAQTFPDPDLDDIQIVHHLDNQEDLDDLFKMYDLSESLTPRMIPGLSGTTLTLVDSHEHDEQGHITEDAELRTEMMHRRMRKLDFLKKEVLEPEYFGQSSAQTILVGWGSMRGALKEAVTELEEQGHSVGALVFGDIYPLPEKKLRSYSKTARRLINVEMNYTGQLAKLIRMETGIEMDDSILKFDGRQLSFKDISNRVKELMHHDS